MGSGTHDLPLQKAGMLCKLLRKDRANSAGSVEGEILKDSGHITE